jgi:hypothetical protein
MYPLPLYFDPRINVESVQRNLRKQKIIDKMDSCTQKRQLIRSNIKQDGGLPRQ